MGKGEEKGKGERMGNLQFSTIFLCVCYLLQKRALDTRTDSTT